MGTIINIFKDYINFRAQLGIHNFTYYFKMLLLPLIFTIIIYQIFTNMFITINHYSISTVLLSTTSIIAAFLVFILTMLLTQRVKKLTNENIDYKKLLINNSEVSVILILSSILLNLFYMLMAAPYTSLNMRLSSSSYCTIINFVSYLSIFMTVFVIQTALTDLLLISKKLK